jgi:hypothetical protein
VKRRHECFVSLGLPKRIPVGQFEVICLDICQLLDNLHQMFEDNKNNSFQTFLLKTQVLLVLDEVIHEATVVKLATHYLLVDNLETIHACLLLWNY